MNTFSFPDGRTVRQSTGDEVEFNIDGESEVEFELCPASSLLYVRVKSFYSSKLRHYGDRPFGKAQKREKGKEKGVYQPSEGLDTTLDFSRAYEVDNALDFDPDDCFEIFAFDEGGEVTEHSRSIAGIRRTYNAIRKKVESTTNGDYTFFMTATLDTYPSLKEMSEVAAKYSTNVRRKYGNFKAGFIFLEPCEDGSWHAHLIVCFKNDELSTEELETDAKKWWKKHNKKESEYQVTVRKIKNLDDLEHTLDYLNPLSNKQDEDDDGKTTKRERLPFYELNCKPMRGFGDVVESIKGTAKMEDLDKLGLKEYDEQRRKRTEVYDTETGELVGFSAEFVFIVDDVAAVQRWLDNVEIPPPLPVKVKPDDNVDHFLDAYTCPRMLADCPLETNQRQIYSMYTRFCEEKDKPYLSKTEFDELLKARGIMSFITPKYRRIGYTIEVTRAARKRFGKYPVR